jgi:TP901 family phage tail tape measure protein
VSTTLMRVVYDLVGVDNASPAMRRAGGSAASTEASFAKLGKTVVLAGAAMGAAAAAVGYESIKMATSFQASMTKIHTQAGASAAEVTKLSGAVLKLASHTQQGPQALADSLYHLESLGLRGAKAMDALATASNLAAVGGANVEDAATAIGAAWRSGIKGAQTFGQSAATVNAIIGAGNMRMEDLISALGTGILPAARTFGVSFKSVGAALALMTDEGIPAVDASTRLRMSLSLLGAPSIQAEKVLKGIGLTGLQLANAMRSPQGIIAAIQLLHDHLEDSGKTASEQAQIISRAFGGGRTSGAIMTLLNNLDVLKRKQDQVTASIGKYGASVEAQRKTAQAQFAILKSNLEALMIKLGLVLLPPVTKFVSFLNATALPAIERWAATAAHLIGSIIPVDKIEKDWHELLSALGLEHPKPMKVLAPQMAGQSAALLHPMAHPNTGIFGSATPALAQPAPLEEGFGAALAKIDWGKVISRATTALVKAGPVLFGAVLDVFSSINWVKATDQIVNIMLPMLTGLVIELPIALIKAIYHHPLDALQLALALIPVGRLLDGVGEVLSHIPIIGKLIEWLVKPVVLAGKFMEKALLLALRGLLKVFDFIAPEIRGKTVQLVKDIGVWLYVHADDIKLAGLKILRGFGNGMNDARDWLYSQIGKIIRQTIEFFAPAVKWLVGHGRDVIEGLWDGMRARWASAAAWIRGIGGRIVGFFARAGRWLLTAGGNIIEGMLGGIRAKMAGIAGWVRGNIVDPVINWVKHFFGIHSPSVVMHGIGFNLVLGMMHGMMSHDLTGFISNIFGSVPKALGSIVSKGLVSLESLPGKAMSALGKLGGFFSNLFGGGGHGSGVEQWSGDVLKALSLLNLPAAYLPLVLDQMQSESGGNPNAINLWDSNAKAGDPSRGLMQTIMSTFLAYAGPFAGLGIYNPFANIYAALNYGKHGAGFGRGPGQIGSMHGYAVGSAYVPATGPALVHRGEMILPAQFAASVRAALAGESGGSAGEFTGNLYLDSGEFLGVVRGEIKENDRQTKRRAKAGTGRAL